MVKTFFEIFNWRFWWFLFIAFLPLWVGIIGCTYVIILEKRGELNEEDC